MDIRNRDVSEVDMMTGVERKEFEAQLRNPSFTVENRKLILKGIQCGLKPRSACEYAGVSTDSFDRWMNRGATTDDPEDPFRIFYLEVKKANRKLEAKFIKYCDAISNPKIALDLLKSRFPEDFGNKQNIELSGNVKTDMDIKAKRDRLSRLMKEAQEEDKEED